MKKTSLMLGLLLIVETMSFGQVMLPEIPRYEAGVFLGQPTGLNAKYWFNNWNAADLTAAWSFSEDGVFEIDADYLLHYFYPQIDEGVLPLYAGLGAGIRIGDDWFIGARIPVGVQYLFERLPISVFAEVDPQWQFLPDNQFVIGGGIGIRLVWGTVQ